MSLLEKKVETPLRIFLSPFEGVTVFWMLTPVTAAEATLDNATAPTKATIIPITYFRIAIPGTPFLS